MKRREFIAGLGSAAAAWPLSAQAQQGARVRRIGVLSGFAESDPVAAVSISGFRDGLAKLGWIEERNLRLDMRFGGTDVERLRLYAAELIGLDPEVIVAHGLAATRIVQQLTKTIPIIFVNVGDPVSNGVVASIARPEGNTTGFTNLFISIAGKWLEMLKEAAPHVARVALVSHAEVAAAENYSAAIETAAATLAVQVKRTPVRNAAEIQRAIDALASEPNGGLIVIPPPFVPADRELINRLAMDRRIPAIYGYTPAEGGLIAYGADTVDLFQNAYTYVDSILRGAKPADLPVQFPVKFRLAINMRTAKAIGLVMPETFLLRADEVIE
jgi:putative tryptophan/tyrosine transport system substrate-binding protein